MRRRCMAPGHVAPAAGRMKGQLRLMRRAHGKDACALSPDHADEPQASTCRRAVPRHGTSPGRRKQRGDGGSGRTEVAGRRRSGRAKRGREAAPSPSVIGSPPVGTAAPDPGGPAMSVTWSKARRTCPSRWISEIRWRPLMSARSSRSLTSTRSWAVAPSKMSRSMTPSTTLAWPWQLTVVEDDHVLGADVGED